MARFSEEERKTIWDMREAGVPVKRIAKHLDRQNSSLRKFIADHGGTRPKARERSELRLSLSEREEISRGLAAGLSIRAIATGLERSPSTVCREVNANGGRRKYRALVADKGAMRRALRPKRTKIAQCRRLRSAVERKLEALWSPQQIAAWLAETYPDNPEMQVSHESIYQSLFVQGRGALRKELHTCLRTGRAMRRAKAYTKGGVGQGRGVGSSEHCLCSGPGPPALRPPGHHGRSHLRLGGRHWTTPHRGLEDMAGCPSGEGRQALVDHHHSAPPRLLAHLLRADHRVGLRRCSRPTADPLD